MLKTRFPVGRHLLQLQADHHTAFALPLLDREGPLYCEQLRRLIPTVRASFRGRFGNRDCFVKVFFSRSRHKHDCTTELNGLAHLASSGCRIPEILYVGPSSDQAASVLVMEWLDDADDLARYFAQHDAEAQTEMLASVADQLARQHNAGCLQDDVHHSNFMCLHRDIVCVDGERVTQKKHAIPRDIGHDNLARFCAQWPPRYDESLRAAIARYGQQRWGDVNAMPDLFPAINRYRQQKLQRLFDLQETSTYPLQHDHSTQCSGVVIAEWHNANWSTILNSPQSYAGEQNTSLRWRDHAVDVVVWNAAPWWQRWTQKSAGQRHFRYSQVLQYFAIPCITTIGFIESWQHQTPRSYAVMPHAKTALWTNWIAQRGESGCQALIFLLQQLHALNMIIADTDFHLIADQREAALHSLVSLHHTASTRRHTRRFRKMILQLLVQLKTQVAEQNQLAVAAVDLGWLATADLPRVGVL